VTVKVIETDPSPSSNYVFYAFVMFKWSDLKEDVNGDLATTLVDERP
jgi:hypothetical protein